MARPTKQGVDYFPVDTDFEDNIEMYLLEKEAVGLAVLVTAWQLIYRNHGYYAVNGEEFCLLIKKRISTGIEVIRECIHSCLVRGIFENSLHVAYGILTSRGIQKRYFDAAKRKKVVAVIKDFLLVCVNEYDNLIYVDINKWRDSRNATNVNVDVNVNVNEKVKGVNGFPKPSRPRTTRLVDEEFLQQLREDPVYQDLDIDKEYGKCRKWCSVNTKTDIPTKKRFVNWVNRAYGDRTQRKGDGLGGTKGEDSLRTAMKIIEELHEEEPGDGPTIVNP